MLAHHGGTRGALVRRVVVEDDFGIVELVDRVEVLAIPGGVVALDQIAHRGCVHYVGDYAE